MGKIMVPVTNMIQSLDDVFTYTLSSGAVVQYSRSLHHLELDFISSGTINVVSHGYDIGYLPDSIPKPTSTYSLMSSGHFRVVEPPISLLVVVNIESDGHIMAWADESYQNNGTWWDGNKSVYARIHWSGYWYF